MFGWWMLPMMITLLCFGWSIWRVSTSRPVGDYGQIGQALGLALLLALSCIISLASWLIWALI